MLFGLRALTQDASMPLTSVGIIEIPGSADRPFDHGTFDETQGAGLQVLSLAGSEHWSIDLPRRPHWCVTDASGERVFLAIREPSMVLTANLRELQNLQHWKLPSAGALAALAALTVCSFVVYEVSSVAQEQFKKLSGAEIRAKFT